MDTLGAAIKAGYGFGVGAIAGLNTTASIEINVPAVTVDATLHAT